MSTVPGSRFPHQRTKKATAPRSSRLEALEPRRVLAAPTLGDLPSEINIYAGAPVHLNLGGADTDGDSLTYTVSSTNPQISASIPKQEAPNGNRSMRITVQGYGQMVFELFEGRAPETTSRIIEIAESDWYNNRIFHRVIDGFMIQGGGFESGMKQKPTRAPIDSEAKNGLKNAAGTLAMARTQDPHSASAQFFINLVDNRPLDYPSRDGWGYAVFGKVSQGFDIVQKIAKVKTGNAGFHQNVPVDPVIIESARLLPAAQPAK